MRVPVRQIPESWPGGIAALDRARHEMRGPIGWMKFFRQMPRTRVVIVVAHAVIELPAGKTAVAEEKLIVVDDAKVRAALFVQNDIVEADAVALRSDM